MLIDALAPRYVKVKIDQRLSTGVSADSIGIWSGNKFTKHHAPDSNFIFYFANPYTLLGTQNIVSVKNIIIGQQVPTQNYYPYNQSF